MDDVLEYEEIVSVPFRGLRGLEEQTQPEHLVAPLPCLRASPHS